MTHYFLFFIILSISIVKSIFDEVPARAQVGFEQFMKIANAKGDMLPPNVEPIFNPWTEDSNYIRPTAFWELDSMDRKIALLIDDLQEGYREFLTPIIPNSVRLVNAFREANLPIFWSSWNRTAPTDGAFSANDRFAGPVGWKTPFNIVYMQWETPEERDKSIGPIWETAPITDLEKERYMYKQFAQTLFGRYKKNWMKNAGQTHLDDMLTKLEVDTVVIVGVWTDYCILTDAVLANSLLYDVVVVTDCITTKTPNQFETMKVLEGFSKLLSTDEILHYINSGMKTKNKEQNVQNETQQLIQEKKGVFETESAELWGIIGTQKCCRHQ